MRDPIRDRSAGRTENRAFRRRVAGKIERREENERYVHLLLTAFFPNGNRFDEFRRFGRGRFRGERRRGAKEVHFRSERAAHNARAKRGSGLHKRTAIKKISLHRVTGPF